MLTVASGGTVNRVAGLVDGNLRKTVPTGVARALTFRSAPRGSYAPVAVSFGTVTTSGTVTGATVTGDHPNLAGGVSLDPTKTVNRYWTLTSAGTAFDAASATFNFTAADLDPGVDPNYVRRAQVQRADVEQDDARHPHCDEHAGHGPHDARRLRRRHAGALPAHGQRRRQRHGGEEPGSADV